MPGALVAEGAVVYGLAFYEEKLHDIEYKFAKNINPVGMDITARKEIASWVSDTFSDFIIQVSLSTMAVQDILQRLTSFHWSIGTK